MSSRGPRTARTPPVPRPPTHRGTASNGSSTPLPPPTAPVEASARSALVLGVIAVAAPFTCCLAPLVCLAPFAWMTGRRASRRIAVSNGALGGRDRARAAETLGALGTLMMVLGIAWLARTFAGNLDRMTFERRENGFSYRF